MARAVSLLIDADALLMAAYDERVETVLRVWLRHGANVVLPASVIVATACSSSNVVQTLLRAIGIVAPITEAIAWDATLRRQTQPSLNVTDALLIATGVAWGVNYVLTTRERHALFADQGFRVVAR